MGLTPSERKLLDDRNTQLLQYLNDKMYQKQHGLLFAVTWNPNTSEIDFHPAANMTIDHIKGMLRDILISLDQGKPIIILDQHGN